MVQKGGKVPTATGHTAFSLCAVGRQLRGAMEAFSRCGAIIILEGNISAGKSTICNALKNLLPNAKAFLEPTATNPYLEKFYADPPSYALKMQLWLLRQRYHIYLDALRFVTSTGI